MTSRSTGEAGDNGAGGQQVCLLQGCLHQAVHLADLEAVRMIVDTFRPDLNSLGYSDAQNKLFIAAMAFPRLQSSDFQTSKWPLLSALTHDSAFVYSVGMSPFHAAVRSNHVHIVKYFMALERGSYDSTTSAVSQSSPPSLSLQSALDSRVLRVPKLQSSRENNEDHNVDQRSCFYLLRSTLGEQSRFVVDVWSRTNFGNTALHLACLYNHIDLIDALLQRMKFQLVEDSENESPRKKRRISVLPTEKSYGFADHTISRIVDTPNNIGLTPLHLACRNGHEHVVRTLLLEYHADPCLKDFYGATPIHKAIGSGFIRTAKILLDAIPAARRHYEINHLRQDGINCLHLAVQNAKQDSVRFICYEMGAILDKNTIWGHDSLFISCCRRSWSICSTLIAAGCLMDSINESILTISEKLAESVRTGLAYRIYNCLTLAKYLRQLIAESPPFSHMHIPAEVLEVVSDFVFHVNSSEESLAMIALKKPFESFRDELLEHDWVDNLDYRFSWAERDVIDSLYSNR